MNKKRFSMDWSKAMDKIKEKDNSKQSFKDERLFIPQYKEDGTFQAIVRFLPSKDTDIPYTDMFTHSFKGPGGYFINNCPTTISKKCPVCEANSIIWDDNPDLVRLRKRKHNYYANILIIKDPQTPENNGKVFLFKYGKKIHDKIMEKWQPPADSIFQPITVFDYYEGANFNLLIKKVKIGKDLMPNYDSSTFDSVSCVGTDEEIEKIHNSLYSLKDFHEEANFKPYDELKERFYKATGQTVTESNVSRETSKAPVTEKEEKIDVNMTEATDDSFFESLQND